MSNKSESAKDGNAAPMVSGVGSDIVRDIVLHWWLRRKFIATVMGIAIAVFIVLLLLVPNRFRAEAKIIILPPKFASDVRTEALSVSTAKNLLGSGELLQSVIDSVRGAKDAVEKLAGQRGGAGKVTAAISELGLDGLKTALGPGNEGLADYLSRLSVTEIGALADIPKSEVEDWTVEDVSVALSSEEIVEKKTASDIKMSPLMNLFAIAETGPKAQLLANTWAILFEKKYDEITNQKTRRQYDFIVKQQQDATAELEKLQGQIVDFKAKNNLELFLKEIDEYTADYREFSNQLIQKQHSLEAQNRRLAELEGVVDSLEFNGVWVGQLNPLLVGDFQAGQDAVTSITMAASPKTQAKSLYVELRARALQSRLELARALSQAKEFYQLQPVDLMEKQLQQAQKDFIDAVSKLRTGEVRKEVLGKSLASLDRQLSATAPFIVLIKDVPDQSIADALITGNRQNLQRLEGVQFRREELNPAWSLLLEQRARTETDFEQTRNEVDEYRSVMASKEKEVRELQDSHKRGKLAEDSMLASVEQRRRANRELYDSYLDTLNSVHNTVIQVALLEQEVKQYVDDTSKTKAMVELIQQTYNESAAKLQLMEIQQKAVQRNVDLLTQKLQEARVAVGQDMSDVSIAAAAVPPTQHFFPRRSLFLILLTALTGAILLGGMAREKYLELKAG